MVLLYVNNPFYKHAPICMEDCQRQHRSWYVTLCTLHFVVARNTSEGALRRHDISSRLLTILSGKR